MRQMIGWKTIIGCGSNKAHSTGMFRFELTLLACAMTTNEMIKRNQKSQV